MDPMTQSAQISSSQGFADGQNSAAKESKMSDKRVIRGSDKPCEGVATSLRFPSQPGSFSSGNYGSDAGPPDEQPDSPIKTSPVSERIKALEALAAKKKEPDFRSDGGFSHFRDRHHEKTSPEIPKYIGETPISPTESQKSPTETQTQKSPTESQKSPTETQKSPTETQKSPTESQKSPTESQTQKSPTESQKSPTESQKSPTDSQTQKSPTVSQKSPTETQKSPNEKIAPTVQKKGGSADQSPESPFEVLEDLRHVNEFEETEEWMKAHLPPVLEFDALIKGAGNVASKGKETDTVIPDAPAAFAGVPDAFMDSPVEPPKQKDEFSDAQKQPSVEEEFDLSFLPTAYMWDQQEKSGVQASSNIDSVLPSSPAPPAGFDSPAPPFSPPAGTNAKPNVSGEKDAAWTGDLEPREASEADSSGESDDTVIEDGVCAPSSVFDLPVLSDPAAAPSSAAPDPDEKVTPLPKSERKLMQVPTINVIETDEPNYSEEEMEMEMEMEPDEDEDYEVVKDPAHEAPKTSEPEDVKTEPPKTRPIETEFMEGYSPPSSPVDSDGEYSPKHKTFKSGPEACHQESTSKSVSNDSAQSDKSQAASNTIHEKPSTFVVTSEDVDFPDNNDEWSDEALDILVKPCKTELPSREAAPHSESKVDDKSDTVAKQAYMETVPLSKTSFMQDDIYDRQSFDYEFDTSSPLDDIGDKELHNAKERFLADPSQILIEKLNASSAPNDVPEDSRSSDGITSPNDSEAFTKPSPREYPQDPYSCFSEQEFNKKKTFADDAEHDNSLPSQKPGSNVQEDTKAAHCAPETNSSLDSSASEPTDSFVEFMRECLKSREDEEPENPYQGVPSKDELRKTSLPHSQSPPTAVMDLEQEKLTISALKELGSGQEAEDLRSAVSDRGQVQANASSTQQSSFTSGPYAPCPESHRVVDSTYSKEVEAIDEWVAEAYHLAEHVLTAILTHLSVKDLIHWRDPKKSGVVFGLSMLLLLSLAAFSVISVASYLLLALLCVTITFRIYKSVVQAVQKSNDGHPFKALIDKDVSIAPETFRKHVDASLTYINRALKQMSRLFLVEDLVDSLKLAVVMWLLTYVGAVFNGITILILANILLFAVPPVYEKNKTQIDQYIDLVRTQVNTTMAKLQEKLPGAVKRSKTE